MSAQTSNFASRSPTPSLKKPKGISLLNDLPKLKGLLCVCIFYTLICTVWFMFNPSTYYILIASLIVTSIVYYLVEKKSNESKQNDNQTSGKSSPYKGVSSPDSSIKKVQKSP